MKFKMLLLWCMQIAWIYVFQSCSTDDQETSATPELFQTWLLDGYGNDSDFRQMAQSGEEYDYYITLAPGDTMEGRSRCNVIYGKYRCDGRSFVFTYISGTKVGCFEETTVFFDAHLPKVSRYKIDNNARLRLYYSESEYLRFRTMY